MEADILKAKRDTVFQILNYMNAETRDGLSHEELCASFVRYLANMAMDLDEEIDALSLNSG